MIGLDNVHDQHREYYTEGHTENAGVKAHAEMWVMTLNNLYHCALWLNLFISFQTTGHMDRFVHISTSSHVQEHLYSCSHKVHLLIIVNFHFTVHAC